jgi:hypothetical protein
MKPQSGRGLLEEHRTPNTGHKMGRAILLRPSVRSQTISNAANGSFFSADVGFVVICTAGTILVRHNSFCPRPQAVPESEDSGAAFFVGS